MQNEVILLFGGKSEEKLVSVASAQNLASHFAFSELLFQDAAEKIYRVSKEELLAHQNVFTTEFRPQKPALNESLEQLAGIMQNKILFLALHGAQGENGELQLLLENNLVKYTGSGPEASRWAFEKNLAKEIISHTEIRMPAEIKFRISEIPAFREHFIKFLALHKKIVFKPTASGSSFGLHIVDSEPALETALESISKGEFQSYLAENFIRGRELTIGVMQDQEELMALPASEIVLNEGHAFDYKGKYLGAGSTEITPARLEEDELLAAQKVALDAHLAFGCYGYSRTDLILTSAGPVFLETNTLPGLSRPSFFPQQLLAADISFSHFINAQIELAARRYETH